MRIYNILSKDDAKLIYTGIKNADWNVGRARTKELTGTIKQNQEILNHPILPRLTKKLLGNKSVQLNHLPKKIHPLKFSRYAEGMHYKLHTDAPWMGETRTDLSCTLWLNDDYEGGELVVETPNGIKKVKGEAGQCFVYDCGFKHQVLPVTRGERVCAVTWIQSRIRDSKRREIVSDLRKVLKSLEGSDDFLTGSKIHSGLLRMWSE